LFRMGFMGEKHRFLGFLERLVSVVPSCNLRDNEG